MSILCAWPGRVVGIRFTIIVLWLGGVWLGPTTQEQVHSFTITGAFDQDQDPDIGTGPCTAPMGIQCILRTFRKFRTINTAPRVLIRAPNDVLLMLVGRYSCIPVDRK